MGWSCLFSQVLPRAQLLNHLGEGQGQRRKSQVGGMGRREEGGRGGGEADKRDQLLFAHKPQVDNEWRGGAGNVLAGASAS